MRIAILPLIALVGAICVVVVILSVILNVSRGETHKRHRGRRRRPQRGPHGMMPTPRPKEPSVRVVRLILAIVFFPVVVVIWALASLGDAIEGAIHVIVGAMAVVFAVLGSLAGGNASAQWRTAGLELGKFARSIYAIGRRFVEYVGFGGFLDRVEDGIRDARRGGPALAPTPPLVNPSNPQHTFAFEDRYRIEGTLAGGGSTARLFVVRRLERDKPVGDRLVLKYFDMGLGSRLEEVMRESRGMQVAREMGIVLDHDLGPEHFYYTMPFYEGETLTRAAARIHRRLLTGAGMERDDLETCLGWMSEALRILDAYHRRGVIHKDVKPDNLIVTDEGIRLVDLGLMTAVESALTLTTHGTEFFRDPEMVKLAIAGKRVKDVDAARFDIYSSGAVLYLLLEGSFPACGPLSRFSRPVPMALTAITSRAMAEGEKRYTTITAMRTDLEAYRQMLRTKEPNDIPMTALPSLAGQSEENLREDLEEFEEIAVDERASAPAPQPPPPPLRPVPPAMAATPMAAAPEPVKSGSKAWVYTAVLLGLAMAVFVFFWFLTAKVSEVDSLAAEQARHAEQKLSDKELSDSVYRISRKIGKRIDTHLARARARGETTPDSIPVMVLAADGLEVLEEGVRRALSDHDLAEFDSIRLRFALRGLLAGTIGHASFAQVDAILSRHDETMPTKPCVVWLSGDPRAVNMTLYGLPAGEAGPLAIPERVGGDR